VATTDVFRFHIANDEQPYETYAPAQRRVNASRGGSKFVLVRGSQLEYRLLCEIAFPQPGSHSEQFPQFVIFAHAHSAEAFLVMPYTGKFMREEVTQHAAAAGQTDFAFEHRYIDAGSVRVSVDGVPQVSGWSVVDNNTAPLIRFDTAPGAGATVDLVANFYVPVHFVTNPLREGEGLAQVSAAHENAPRSVSIELVETEPGARFVDKKAASSGP